MSSETPYNATQNVLQGDIELSIIGNLGAVSPVASDVDVGLI